MTPDERAAMFETLSTEEKADEMDFVLARPHPKPNQTFSADALDDLTANVKGYIVARIGYHWKGRGPDVPGPSNIRVEVKVTIDDESYPPLADNRPWYVIDGTKRRLDA